MKITEFFTYSELNFIIQIIIILSSKPIAVAFSAFYDHMYPLAAAIGFDAPTPDYCLGIFLAYRWRPHIPLLVKMILHG